ncbi:hypothetical protein I7I51_00716 [Histoplasma capsulatum]|uniref:Uncharacterized protein n=1 Tax=Ajellomyces capsulatus TaxID=5037 RepID=A0A8A1MHR8_AJECA|nr:hypothetical protein I7I51_00716 [Histoplasma capsulatum]
MKAMVVQIIRCTVHVYLDTRSWYSYGGIGGEKVKAPYSIKEMWTYNNIDSPPFMTNARRIWGTELGWIASRGVDLARAAELEESLAYQNSIHNRIGRNHPLGKMAIFHDKQTSNAYG